jgi:hypothetical protein
VAADGGARGKFGKAETGKSENLKAGVPVPERRSRDGLALRVISDFPDFRVSEFVFHITCNFWR